MKYIYHSEGIKNRPTVLKYKFSEVRWYDMIWYDIWWYMIWYFTDLQCTDFVVWNTKCFLERKVI